MLFWVYFIKYFYIFFKCLHDFPLTVRQALDDSRYWLFVLILITRYFSCFTYLKKTHFIYSRFNESSSRDPRIFLINVCTVTSFDLLKESVYRGIKSGVGINDFQHRLFFLKGFSLNVSKF